jgi:prepilin-type N-terminal cleavage/methylation domain-containing protein
MWRRLQPANLAPPRRGFTLVELLLVIGIIGLLTAISVPVVMQSLAKARNAAIKAEIDMLHMAIMNYKNEYGSFPPCASSIAVNDVGVKHIAKLFPRWSPATLSTEVTQFNALNGWLSGYSNNPTDPLGSPRTKLYDFDQSRLSNGQYYPAGKNGSPYIYTNNSQYFTSRSSTSYLLRPYVELMSTEDVNDNGTLDQGEDVNGNSQLDVLPFNESTFQIICAGRDEAFDTDDDLSNFWPGTRREYLDSLKN